MAPILANQIPFCPSALSRSCLPLSAHALRSRFRRQSAGPAGRIRLCGSTISGTLRDKPDQWRILLAEQARKGKVNGASGVLL